jgi:hypothetical protein
VNFWERNIIQAIGKLVIENKTKQKTPQISLLALNRFLGSCKIPYRNLYLKNKTPKSIVGDANEHSHLKTGLLVW